MTRMNMCLWIAGNTDTDTDTDLRVHERLHTDEKLFKCHHCDKTLVKNYDLRLHERLLRKDEWNICQLELHN